METNSPHGSGREGVRVSWAAGHGDNSRKSRGDSAAEAHVGWMWQPVAHKRPDRL